MSPDSLRKNEDIKFPCAIDQQSLTNNEAECVTIFLRVTAAVIGY